MFFISGFQGFISASLLKLQCHYTKTALVCLLSGMCYCMKGNHVMIQAQPGLKACSAGLGPGALQLAMFCAECFRRPVSQEGAGRRCDSCVGHGCSDLHTSSWWIIKAVTIHWTCCVGLCLPDYSLVMIRSRTTLIQLFKCNCWQSPAR